LYHLKKRQQKTPTHGTPSEGHTLTVLIIKRKNQMKMTIISVLCAANLLWINTASANLISNGDFETGDFGAWKTSGDDVVITNEGPFSAAEGMDGYYAGIGLDEGSTINRIWQDFDVSGYNSVQVSFDWVFDFNDVETGLL
jgi:hypothetical protein